VWKQIVVAGMVVMEMADDDVLDGLRCNADGLQPFADRLEQRSPALFGDVRIKAGVDEESAGPPNDRPHEIIERLQDIVRVADDEIVRRSPLVTPSRLPNSCGLLPRTLPEPNKI
jgi:hypothetical protein